MQYVCNLFVRPPGQSGLSDDVHGDWCGDGEKYIRAAPPRTFITHLGRFLFHHAAPSRLPHSNTMAFYTRVCARMLIFSHLFRLSLAALYYPNPQVHFLEHILVDNWGAYASNFSSAITPCSNYVTEVGEPAAVSGRTTAAQWMRVAFHDFVTANVSAGTGGLDGSIGFETLRSENSGSAFNDSFTFWRPFVNDAVASKSGLKAPLGGRVS